MSDYFCKQHPETKITAGEHLNGHKYCIFCKSELWLIEEEIEVTCVRCGRMTKLLRNNLERTFTGECKVCHARYRVDFDE